MESGNLFVQDLGDQVALLLIFAGVLVGPQFNLGNSLVGERVGHDERRMTSGASQVQQSTFSQDDDAVTVGEDPSGNLGFDVDLLNTFDLLQTSHVDFVIEMTDVSNNSVVLHLLHVLGHDDIEVTGGGDEDIDLTNNLVESDNGDTVHSGLQSADGVDFSDHNLGTSSLHGGGTSLSDITETEDQDLLTGDHNIGGSHDTIGERVSATVDVIELGLGDRVVDVDSGEQEFTSLGHLVESQDTGGGFLRNTLDTGGHVGPSLGVLVQTVTEDSVDFLHFQVFGGVGVGLLSGLFEFLFGLDTFVDEQGSVTSVINDHVGSGTFSPVEGAVGAVPVFSEGFSLPGEDSSRLGIGDSSSGVILSGEDVARAPSDFGTQSLQGFDQNSGLDGHMQRSSDFSTSQRLGSTIFRSARHQTGHFNLSHVEFLAAPFGEGHILNVVVVIVLHVVD
mmetsp:Transcript_60139/g.68467  ORF Transcript_60139/g.68467 Transcript_60139/m.68467 type:complete len:448 (+) Transcript_60139:448-1791(+)